MSEFHRAFAELFESGLFKNPSEFAKLAGTNRSYVSDILTDGSIPKPSTLHKYLTKAGVPKDPTERLVYLCRVGKLLEDEEIAPLWTEVTRRQKLVSLLVARLADGIAAQGKKLPQEILSAIQDLKVLAEGDRPLADNDRR